MKVSICIPHYKQEDYLKNAVRSAVTQAAPGVEVEVLVSDNASGNTAGSVLKEIEATWQGVRVIRNPYNIGMVANFNKVVGESTGDIICLLSADDELLPGAVAKVCKEFSKDQEVALVYGRAKVIDEEGHLTDWPKGLPGGEKFLPPEYAELNLRAPEIPLVSAFFRKDIFQLIGGFKGEAGPVTDWHLWSEIGRIGLVVKTGEFIGQYRVHKKSETASARNSFRWIMYHYLSQSTFVDTGGYAQKAAVGTVLRSLMGRAGRLARRQALLIYCLWPSFRTLGLLCSVAVLSHLPAGVSARVYKRLKQRGA